jgi:hypothetical protein
MTPVGASIVVTQRASSTLDRREPALSGVEGRLSLRELWLNQTMFVRKIRVEYEAQGEKSPCPLKWLDSFSMRNFTNASVFDDTLPVADGLMEIGRNVPLDQLREAMEDWFRRKGYLAKDAKLTIAEMQR